MCLRPGSLFLHRGTWASYRSCHRLDTGTSPSSGGGNRQTRMAVSLHSEAAIVVSELRETPDSLARVLRETWCTGRAHAGLGGGLT
jgi:hypothetical protein